MNVKTITLLVGTTAATLFSTGCKKDLGKTAFANPKQAVVPVDNFNLKKDSIALRTFEDTQIREAKQVISDSIYAAAKRAVKIAKK